VWENPHLKILFRQRLMTSTELIGMMVRPLPKPDPIQNYLLDLAMENMEGFLTKVESM